MNPQYEILAKCLLPTHMLEWFELTNVEVKPKENTATQDTQSEESPVNIIHLYLDENNLTPDNREDLRPNGFTPAKTFHDFPIRGQEVLLHVRRREVMTEVANARDDFRAMIKDLIKSGKPLVDAEGKPIRSNAAYHPERLKNNETKAELLMRSKYLLMVSPEKWTPSQRERAEILFELYPDIEMAYSLTHSLRMIFAQKCDKEAGRKSIKKWYAKVGEFDNKAFNDIAAAMYDREDEILNYFVNRSTNASAESLNAKIKDFRAQLRGVIDKKFFIFRLVKIFG